MEIYIGIQEFVAEGDTRKMLRIISQFFVSEFIIHKNKWLYILVTCYNYMYRILVVVRNSSCNLVKTHLFFKGYTLYLKSNLSCCVTKPRTQEILWKF